MAIVISADEIKKQLPNYSPEKAESFHPQSAKLADKEFYSQLKDPKIKDVILLCGGSASGKTEFLATHLSHHDCLIFDTTLSSEQGAKIKLNKIIHSGKIPIVYAIIPDDIKRAFLAFLHRDRKFSDIHFYKTHSGSRRTLLWIIQNYPQIKLHLIESSYTSNESLQFIELKFDNHSLLVSYLKQLQMNEDAIISSINTQL